MLAHTLLGAALALTLAAGGMATAAAQSATPAAGPDLSASPTLDVTIVLAHPPAVPQ
jgi:hypothetical protein